MSKISFKSDYSEAGHPRIIEAVAKIAYEQNGSYGTDKYSLKAADLIREEIGQKDADVHFLTGGTQANLVNLCHILRPYESVIACDTGHIAVHEAGAIEATGHRINTVPDENGKIKAQAIEKIVKEHRIGVEHMVVPKAVFISQPTELGTVYSKSEMEEISQCCKENGLYLYIDGARLGQALVNEEANMTLQDIASMTDVFYIGITKNGGFFGEATVIVNDELKGHYRHSMKQRGALLAKGALLGIQFKELFKDGLFMDLARHAAAMSRKLVEILETHEVKFKTPPQTNMIFPIFPEDIIEKLEKHFDFYRWEEESEGMFSVRLVTSWATKEEDIEKFERIFCETLQSNSINSENEQNLYKIA